MDNQEVLKAIAVLADKVSRYHERLLAVERDQHRHESKCSCQSKTPTMGRPLTEEEKLFVQQNIARQAIVSSQDS